MPWKTVNTSSSDAVFSDIFSPSNRTLQRVKCNILTADELLIQNEMNCRSVSNSICNTFIYYTFFSLPCQKGRVNIKNVTSISCPHWPAWINVFSSFAPVLVNQNKTSVLLRPSKLVSYESVFSSFTSYVVRIIRCWRHSRIHWTHLTQFHGNS